MSHSPPTARPGASLALAALVAIVVLAPWPFGSVGSVALAVVVGAALAAAAVSLALAAARGGVVLPAVPVWPLGAFVTLTLAQLVPLPPLLHSWLAPGSARVWHPGEPAVAAVLGSGPHPISLDPSTTLRAAALVAGLGLVALVASPALASERGARRALAALALGGFALAAYAIWARARFGVLLYGQLSVPTVAPFGPFVNKNHFAGWAAMAALLTTGFAVGLAGERRRGADWTVGRRAALVVLAAIAALVMALAVLASLSRGGALALAGGGACLAALLLARGPLRPRAARPGLALAALVAGLVVVLAPPAARARLRSLDGAEFRVATWRDALRLAGASPLVGHGLGAFHDAFPLAKQSNGALRVEHAESEYLETLGETGFAGLTLAVLGLLVLLRAGWRAERGGLVGGVARGAAAALLALAIHSVFDFDLRIPSNAALAALAASAAAAGAGPRSALPSRGRTAALALAAVALLVATLALPARSPLPAREDVRQAWSSPSPQVRALRLERAEVSLADALRLRPADAESWLLLAGVRAARGDARAAAALARHAAWLDPQRANLLAAASRLARRAESP